MQCYARAVNFFLVSMPLSGAISNPINTPAAAAPAIPMAIFALVVITMEFNDEKNYPTDSK